ncbi:hypothetical protein BJV74DRAFT_796707 [Russula compacta]|nr:hypothetical protein BJV74DRAFT_796707 [Russula compacta]
MTDAEVNPLLMVTRLPSSTAWNGPAPNAFHLQKKKIARGLEVQREKRPDAAAVTPLFEPNRRPDVRFGRVIIFGARLPLIDSAALAGSYEELIKLRMGYPGREVLEISVFHCAVTSAAGIDLGQHRKIICFGFRFNPQEMIILIWTRTQQA